MRWHALAREAARDILTGTARLVTWALLAALLAGAVSVAHVWTIRDGAQKARDFRSAAASTWVMDSPGNVDGAACAALAGVGHVVSAAPVRDAADRALTVLPSAPINISEAGPGILDVLDPLGRPHRVSGGVVLVEQVAETVGLSAGDTASFRDGEAHVAAVVPWDEEDGRAPGHAWAAFAVTPASGVFDQCWVEVWPQDEESLTLLRVALLRADQAAIQATQTQQLNTTLGRTFDMAEAGAGLAGRAATAVVGAVALLLGWVSVRMRRLEIASDLHAGVSRADMTVKILAETTAWLATGIALTTPALSWVVASAAASDRSALLLTASADLLVWLCAGLVGALASTLMIRERHLLVAFRART